jgi:predicted RNA binding protein YcfA (HicA-like mRNA interferase family)
MTARQRSLLRTAPAEVLKEIEAEGWEITPTGKSHWKWIHPGGGLVFSSSTPSDWRNWANHLALMRKARKTTRSA